MNTITYRTITNYYGQNSFLCNIEGMSVGDWWVTNLGRLFRIVSLTPIRVSNLEYYLKAGEFLVVKYDGTPEIFAAVKKLKDFQFRGKKNQKVVDAENRRIVNQRALSAAGIKSKIEHLKPKPEMGKVLEFKK